MQGRVWLSRILSIKTLSERLLEEATSGYMPTRRGDLISQSSATKGTHFSERERVLFGLCR
jgi:hypothetical protein